MNQAELYALAKKKMGNTCRLCDVCNGVACAGKILEFGGIGTGSTFHRNWEALQEYDIVERHTSGVTLPDTHIEMFGQKLTMPIIAGPMGSIARNAKIEADKPEIIADRYVGALAAGIERAGVLAMIGDGPQSYSFAVGMKYASSYPGRIISIVKPRPDEVIIQRAEMAARLGEPAFGVDVDASKLLPMTSRGQNIEIKTPDKLKKIVSSVSIPFVVKGVMSMYEAEICARIGAAAIVVSNHGGRILDGMPGTADVLPKIANAVKGRILILVDGGIRTGEDVFKMLALGADAVLIARPVAFGVIGNGADGVQLLFNEWQRELTNAMVKAGAIDLQHIHSGMIKKNLKST
jgi:4-hydroxymandelate oxidase